MHARPTPGSRAVAAFVALAGALFVVAWLALAGGRAYVDAQRRIDDVAHSAQELSGLLAALASAEGAERDNLTQRGVRYLRERAGAVGSVDVEVARARHLLDNVERLLALMGALVVALLGSALAVIMPNLRHRRHLSDRLDREANHDPVTGLPSHRFFGDWLGYAIANARRQNRRVGVLFIDIDGLSAIGDLHGPEAVDTLLVEIARRFRTGARDSDLFARVDASRFALATPNAADRTELALLAQRLRDTLNDPALPPLADTPIGASVGIAFFPEDAGDPAGVMAAANAAMYVAQRAGKDRVAFNALAA